MARACSWLILSLAAVCITTSALEEVIDPDEQRLFDSLAPLLSDSPPPGELGESVDLSTEPENGTQVTQKLSVINKKLVAATHSEVVSTLDKLFTPALWEEWNSEVAKKKLEPDTATGILNSYLCANVKDARVLVQAVEWVKKNSGAGPKDTAADSVQADEKQAEEKKVEEKKKNVEEKEVEGQKVEEKEEKVNGKKTGEKKTEEKKVEEEKDETKEEKEAVKAKDRAVAATDKAETASEATIDTKAEKEAKVASQEKSAVVEAEKDQEMVKKDEATKVLEVEHQKKEQKLEKKVDQAAAKIDAEKVKADKKVAQAVKEEQKKAAGEVKAAEDKAATAEKAVERAEQQVTKAEKQAEKKMKQVEDKAAEKVEGEKVKAEKKAEKKVVEAKVEAEKEVAQAKQKEQAAEKQVEDVKKQAKQKVETVKAQVVKKQDVQIDVQEVQVQKQVQKKVKKEIKKAEVAAVASISAKSQSAPAQNVVQQVATEEKEAEVKTLSLSSLLAESKTKVADATEILIHATKINKFVSKSDELLHIAKMGHEQVLDEAKKQEKIAEQKAKDLKQLQVKTAKAQLADYKMILENAIKDANQMVDNEQNKLKTQEQALHATRVTVEADSARLEKLKSDIAPKQSNLLKLQAATADDNKALARAQGGLRLAEQSEIPEAVRIASERIRKIQSESQAELNEVRQVESTVKNMEGKYQILAASVEARQKAEIEQTRAVDALKSNELPKLTAETQARIRALEGDMGKKIDAILLVIKDATPKGIQKIRTAIGKAAIENPLEQEKVKRAAAETSAAQFKQQIQQLQETQKVIMGTIEGPGGMGKLEQDAASDVELVQKATTNTEKIVKQAEQVKDLKSTLKGKKAELETQLSTSAPGSAKEVATLKELEAVNSDEKTMMVEGAKVEEAASKNTQALAVAASKGVVDEKKLEAAKVLEASTKVHAAQASIGADLKQISDANQKIAVDKVSKSSVMAKIQEIKMLIKANNGTDYSVAIKQLEGYEKRAESIAAEESQLASSVKVATASIKVQKAVVADSAAKLGAAEKASATATNALKATEVKAKAEHDKFEGGGALAQSEAKAVTESQEAQKELAVSEMKAENSQKENTQLKEKLAASSAASVAVAEDTEKFVKKNASPDSPSLDKKLKGDIAGVKKAIKQKKELAALASKASSKVSSSKAELELANEEGNPKAAAKAAAKVTQYSQDVKKIQVAKKMVAAKQLSEQQEIQELHQLENSETTVNDKVEGFEKGALKKWGQVHQMAEASAKQEMDQVDQIQKEVNQDKVVIASKDSQISKLKLALNMAMNPQTVKQVAKIETRETEIRNELARSESSYQAGLKKHEETKASLEKAALEGDQHAEMILGAQDQDLKVALKRAKFHLEGLSLALNKEQDVAAAQEKSHETIEPDTPAADLVHKVEAKAESQEARAMKIVNHGKEQSAKVEKVAAAPEEKVDTEVKVAIPEAPKAVKPTELAESNVSVQEQQFELLKAQLKLEKRENDLLKTQKVN